MNLYTKHFIGIDPDMHCLPIVTVNEYEAVTCISVIKPSKKAKGRDAVIEMSKAVVLSVDTNMSPIMSVAVESQEIVYSARSGKNPRALCMLANISGIALHEILANHPDPVAYLPTPQQWKGSVPKEIHHARIFKKIGWSYEKASGYCYPTNMPDSVQVFGKLNRGDWKHVADAVGLALYARDRYLKENK